MAPHIVDSAFDVAKRRYITALRYACSRVCFEREIFSHYRMMFEKICA
jgi:hypothetical protein